MCINAKPSCKVQSKSEVEQKLLSDEFPRVKSRCKVDG